MDHDTARDFVRTNHRGVLIARKADGSPQTSPVTAAVGDDGRLIISSRETAYKVKNLLRDPAVVYTGFTDAFYGDWIQVDGTAEIVHLPEAMDLLVDYYRKAAGEHEDWDEYKRAMVDQKRVVIAVTITKAGPDVSG